jgi:hypothetical protein
MATINPKVKRNGQNIGTAGTPVDPNPGNTGAAAGSPSASIVTKKTKAPFTNVEEFMTKAQAMNIKLGDNASVIAGPKAFSTGSYGFNANGKVTVVIDGKAVTLQCSINLVVVGSKPE